MEKSQTAITIGLIAIIAELVLNVAKEYVTFPSWINIVTWSLTGICIICIILYFILKRKENKK